MGPTMETVVQMPPWCGGRTDSTGVAYEHSVVTCDTHICAGGITVTGKEPTTGTHRYSSASSSNTQCHTAAAEEPASCCSSSTLGRHRGAAAPNPAIITECGRHGPSGNTKLGPYHSCGSEDAFIQQRHSNNNNKASSKKVLYVELVRSQLALRSLSHKRRQNGYSFLTGGNPFHQHLWTLVLLVWVLALVLITDMVTYGPDMGGDEGEGSDLDIEDSDDVAAVVVGSDQHSPGSKPKAPRPVGDTLHIGEVPVSRPLRVEVYYEALCPDSRSFVMKQLLPAYTALSDIMDVHIVPYGKAKTIKESTGEIGFQCQHGPTECEANGVHACVSNTIKDQAKVLNIVSCMIDRNSNPLKIGQFCVEKFGEAWSDVEKCLKSDKASKILQHMGELTHSLKPKVSFIPTITIDGSQEEQRLILRSFQKVLCNRFKGPKPENCP